MAWCYKRGAKIGLHLKNYNCTQACIYHYHDVTSDDIFSDVTK